MESREELASPYDRNLPAISTSPLALFYCSYDPDFGAKVRQAYFVKERTLQFAHTLREVRYGVAVACKYARGDTPENVRLEYNRRQEEAMREFELEVGGCTDDDEDPHSEVVVSL